MASRSPLARGRRIPVCFVAFDCLWLDGDLTRQPYTARREALESLRLRGKAWWTAPSFPAAGAELFAACTTLGLEGLVAKRLDGRYYPGERKGVWVKAKCRQWLVEHAAYRHER